MPDFPQNASDLPGSTAPAAAPARPLIPAAQRALAEAEARRQARDRDQQPCAIETGGRAGPDPVRYGDWETGGIASDF